MNKIFSVCLALAILVAIHARAAPSGETYPRLWEVTGKASDGSPTRFYLLGITHNGLPTEYDDYYQNRVLPVFDRVDRLSSENSSFLTVRSIPCPEPLPPTEANAAMLAAAHERIASLVLQLAQQSPMPQKIGATPEEQKKMDESTTNDLIVIAHTLSASDSEFSLIWDLRTLSYSVAFPTLPDEAEGRARLKRWLEKLRAAGSDPGNFDLHASIPEELMKRRPTLSSTSIDEPVDLLDGYCGIKPESRAAVFERMFKDHEFHPYTEESLPKAIEDTRKTDEKFRNVIKAGQIPKDGFEGRDAAEGLVCVRNPRWIKKMLTPSEGKVTLYALGLAHLLPYGDDEVGGLPCDDLPTALSKAGMAVKLVQ